MVNASLMVYTTATDTTFKYLCDWQYRDTVELGISARSQSLLLMSLDKNVFGERLYKITDTLAFGNDGMNRNIFYAKLNSSITNRTAKSNFAYKTQLFELITITFCYDFWVPANQGQLTGCRPGEPNCNDYTLETECETYSYWAEVIENGGGTGGSGGTGSGGGGSGSGGGSTPNECPGSLAARNGNVTDPCTPGWVPVPPATTEDPCITANNAAKKMDSVFIKSRSDSILASIPNFATETKEKGYPIMKRFSVNPSNVHDTTITSYYSGNVQTGTDSNIVIQATYPYLTLLAATLHTHPASGYSAHSAKDVYELIGEQMQNSQFEGTFVAAANGSQYVLTVTDYASAAAFYATMSQNLNGTTWKADSDIGKEFEKAKLSFEDKFKNDSNKNNLAYEMSMAAVLSQFNTGVTLNKKDAAGNFKPIVIRTSQDPRKPKRKIYTQECI